MLKINEKKLKTELIKFGNRLKILRKDRGLTQEQLSDKIEMFDKYYSNIERGLRNISFKNILKISKGFEIEIKELFDYFDEYKMSYNRTEKIDSLMKLLKRVRNDSQLDFIHQMIEFTINFQGFK